jgi:hypothetical protein
MTLSCTTVSMGNIKAQSITTRYQNRIFRPLMARIDIRPRCRAWTRLREPGN